MLRPSPVPVGLISECSSSFEKFWKSFSRFSGFIPTPVSSISILNRI
jgi:hypothetical protein